VVPSDGAGNDTLAGLKTIGKDTQSYVGGVPQFDTPNHNYDTSDFDGLVAAITRGDLPASALPAVSFLKAPGYQDGHAAYSDPADEQAFVVHEINSLMRSPDWKSTAIFINYDDSDGWYDHAYPGVQNPSNTVADVQCGSGTPLAGQQGRCGFGPRLPLLVISPYAKSNFVDHNWSDQTSMINFVEYNWKLKPIAGSADQILAKKDKTEKIPFDLAGMFDFKTKKLTPRLILRPATGTLYTG
jgi:phospholipase C